MLLREILLRETFEIIRVSQRVFVCSSVEELLISFISIRKFLSDAYLIRRCPPKRTILRPALACFALLDEIEQPCVK